MKPCKKALALLLMTVLTAAMAAGCKAKDQNNSSSGISENSQVSENSGTGTGNNNKPTLYIFNSKGENAKEFEAMCEAYTAETGVPTKPFSVGAGTDASEPLRAQMNSNTPPAIFSIMGVKELPEWQQSGTALDLTTVEDSEFKSIVEGIPENMRLTTDGKASYGIPFNVEGYGYMVDSQMLDDLFGANSHEALLKDLRTCSYEDFTKLCEAIDQYVATPSAAKVTVNGNEYTFQADKTGLAKNLTGVFAFAGSEKWTYGDHAINIAINTVFSSPIQAADASDEQLDQLKEPFVAYAKMLDFVTQHVGGLKGHATRGRDLINASSFGYDQSIQMYADSNAVFLQQGNWASANIGKVNQDVANRSSFIPLKCPVTDDMIKTGKTAAEFNSSIPVYVPNYYAVNAKVSEEIQQEAINFLKWMQKTENVNKYIVGMFKAVPYNASENIEMEDALGSSIMSYVKEGRTLSDPYNGAPASWSSEVVGKQLMEQYLIKEQWSENDYSDIADFAISKWKEMKNAQ